MIRQAGQRYFVMMRPMAHEKQLPSSLFRWRSPDGHEVLTYRIIGAYLCASPDNDALRNHVWAALSAPRPDGVEHVMCFYGVGNHGGGPTRKLVEWIRAHREFAPGVKLEFSSPQRYFTAVESNAERFPIVEGELQHHAIGCYSVCGALKREIRAAELAAIDLDRLARQHAVTLPAEYEAAWRTICFNQFHDVVAGSSLSSATETARQQIGGARDLLEQMTYTVLRRDTGVRNRLPIGHRLHVVNRSPVMWTGLADLECELSEKSHLVAADGSIVPHQLVSASSVLAESFCAPVPRILFPVTLSPGEMLTFRIIPEVMPPVSLDAMPRFVSGRLENGLVQVEFDSNGIRQIISDGKPLLSRPLSLVALADGSDTWSHDGDKYMGPIHARGKFAEPVVVESGPLRTMVRLDGQIGSSRARLYVTLDWNSPRVDLRLDVNYQEPFTVLKMALPVAGGIRERRDRVGGGWLDRSVDGREYPVHHVIRVNEGAATVGVVFPDSFAADCSAPGAIRVTLLRNNIHAYHSNSRIPHDQLPQLCDRFGTDEGPQSLRFSILNGPSVTEEHLESVLAFFQRPPWIWTDYRGVSRVQEFE